MSRHVVVDTDVVSFLFKKDSRAEKFRPFLDGKTPVVSFMTVAELYRWTLVRNWGVRRVAKLEEYLRQFAVYPFNDALCKAWARATNSAEKKRRPITTADAWIAATAALYDTPLVTNNSADFQGVEGLVILSPKSD